jgi:hypothetical protein
MNYFPYMFFIAIDFFVMQVVQVHIGRMNSRMGLNKLPLDECGLGN